MSDDERLVAQVASALRDAVAEAPEPTRERGRDGVFRDDEASAARRRVGMTAAEAALGDELSLPAGPDATSSPRAD